MLRFFPARRKENVFVKEKGWHSKETLKLYYEVNRKTLYIVVDKARFGAELLVTLVDISVNWARGFYVGSFDSC